jgi:hypothetical protein
MDAQTIILLNNLQQHKRFRHIVDDDEAKDNFIFCFAPIMREIYCGYICRERFIRTCATAYLPKHNIDYSKDLLEQVMDEILSRHLDAHKWYRHIADTEEAKRDFLNEFGGIISEMIRNFPPQKCTESSTPETSGDEQKDSV